MSGTRSYAANDHRLICAPVWEKDKIGMRIILFIVFFTKFGRREVIMEI